jgi:flavodoxin/NAD-dependent dihydropyrimidine dehydrogenase PreA subunit
MVVAILFFSGTGNTYYVARTIQDSLQRLGHHCDLHAMEERKNQPIDISVYDVIGLGFPVYGSSAPSLVKDYIKLLQGKNKSAFCFVTQMMYSGDGAAYGGRLLKKQGFVVDVQMHFNMPNNITDVKFLQLFKRIPYEKILLNVQKKVDFLLSRIINKRPYKLGSNPISLFLGLLQRVPYERYERILLPSIVKVNQDDCIHCGLCISLCPVQNLMSMNEVITDQGQCMTCYRCINHCPASALTLAGKSKVRRPYTGPTPSFDVFELKKHHLQ